MRCKLRNISRVLHEDLILFRRTVTSQSAKNNPAVCNTTKLNKHVENNSETTAAEKTGNNSSFDRPDPEYRENEMRIQMLSKSIFDQIFMEPLKGIEPDKAKKFQANLKQHGIQPGDSARIKDVKSLKLPRLYGANIEEHFRHIAQEQAEPYQRLIQLLVTLNAPAMPTEWILTPGWTHYCPQTKTTRSVSHPDDEALVFDIENCVQEGSAPTIACALGSKGWYSWVSPSLISGESRNQKRYHLSDLIPIEPPKETSQIESPPRIIVGHNVSYDRARVREQYLLRESRTRFLDTMSMHVCVSGVTSYQRAMMKAKKELPEEDLIWRQYSSLNSLGEVYRLYCPDAEPIDKQLRNVFVDGSLTEIREDFQNLMKYCASDVLATHRVLSVLYPKFCDRFPHPATLAGMLEIGMAYLPVTSAWRRYIQSAHLSYDDLNIEAKRILEQRANVACRLADGEQWRRDIWMWDQDWSVQELRLNKGAQKKTTKKVATTTTTTTNTKTKKKKGKNQEPNDIVAEIVINETDSGDVLFQKLEAKFKPLMDKRDWLPARRPLLPGYPAWYRNLCEKNRGDGNWTPGPSSIGTGMQVTPKLLRLCWEGYPLHYIKGQGWGFLVPFNVPLNAIAKAELPELEGDIPLGQLVTKCPVIECGPDGATSNETDDAFQQLVKQVEMNLSKRDYYRKKPSKKSSKTDGLVNPAGYTGSGVWADMQLSDHVWFVKLPHKDGASSRVGNPMAKDFLSKFAENVLTGEGQAAERVIRIAGQCSYWRNNRDRIEGQMVVWLDDEEELGAIVPQVVVSGTLTRRAMEPTWMTASNAQRERVGSELRGMVTAPNGYRFVGADVDSQELWIAAVLGDAAETGCHGATPFGWMTLNGSKADATDMHSVTAKAVGISRDHAKIINYARIYGAGQQFAERLLKQFNPTLPDAEAKSKAMKMFALTKGKRLYRLRAAYQDQFVDKSYTRYEASKVCAAMGQQLSVIFEPPKWYGGTESAMFNRLEEIAEMAEPVTPFLQCRLSRPLEPQPNNGEDRFLPTRVNWVVQSGAVDFLHLMLVCMRWLMGGSENIRFSLSFHDEIRYLVPESEANRAAVAMHVTNLLTRAFCAHRLGLTDLPQSVAFFQSVEVDRVLRKESRADYKTPSNPHGLEAGYGIAAGESLNIEAALDRIRGQEDMSQWPWHKNSKNNKNQETN